MAFAVPDDDLPDVTLLWIYGCAGIGDIERFRGLDATRIPGACLAREKIVSVRRDEDFVAGLHPIWSQCIALPGKRGLRSVDAKRVYQSVCTEVNRNSLRGSCEN